MVIELNPFYISAGAGLFSWRLDRERFLNGPFEFRITESFPEEGKDILPLRWARWLRTHYGPVQGDDLLEEEKEEDSQSSTLPWLLLGVAAAGALALGLLYFRWRRS